MTDGLFLDPLGGLKHGVRAARWTWWKLRDWVGAPAGGALEQAARLSWREGQLPRGVGGLACVDGRTVEYVDGPSLLAQYWHLFVCQGYAFECDQTSPKIVDCGANIGMSVWAFKHQYPEARVTAYEADPHLVGVLTRNVARMALSNVTSVHAAASDLTGTVRFSATGADTGHVDSREGTLEVPAIRLAETLGEPVDLLKLDIEGAEFEVLEDLQLLDALSRVRRLVCELHLDPTTIGRLGAILTGLSGAGFRFRLSGVENATYLPGEADPSPFVFPCESGAASSDGRFLCQLYAWRPE